MIVKFKYTLLLTIFVNSLVFSQDKTIETYIPDEKTIIAEVWTIATNQEAEIISKKIINSIKANQEWMENYIRSLKLKPGEKMPFHKNFGVSRKDYLFFISSIDKLQLKKLKNINLNINKTPRNISFKFENNYLPVKDFTYDIESNSLITVHGVLDKFSVIDQSEGKSVLGKWIGLQWKKEIVTSINDSFRETIAIGKYKNKQSGIIYYDLKSSQYGSSYFVITYELK